MVKGEFKDRLRLAIDARGKSASVLADETGLDRRTIYLYLNPYKYKRGTCLGANNLEALADALDVTMDWLWGRSDDGGV